MQNNNTGYPLPDPDQIPARVFCADRYMHVEWLKGGRDFPQLDCFGLINEVRADLGLTLWPDFSGVTKDGGGLDREARRLMLRLERCDPCEGAGIACYSGSVVTHVAVVVCIDGILYAAECNPGSNVSFTPVARFARKFIKVEYWK